MPLSRCRILIVEDQALLAIDLACAIQDANGCVIGPAGTVKDALASIRHELIHAAILDAHLPDGDVIPVAEALIARDIPVVLLTGVASPLALRQRHPDIPVFLKPIATTRLIRALAGLLPLDPAGVTGAPSPVGASSMHLRHAALRA